MDIDLPELSSVDVDGPIVFREWSGPSQTTFVLIHGLGGSHVSWVQVALGLSGLGRVVAPDLPGFGRSPAAGRSARVMDLRRALAGFVEQVATGEVVLVGNSMGGLVAMTAAAVDPDRVAGLVLTASVFPWVRGAVPHPAVLGAFALYDLDGVGERVIRTRRRAVSPETFVAWGLRLLAVDPGRIPADVVSLQTELIRDTRDDPEQPHAFIQAARSITTFVRSPAISSRVMDAIRCPALVIHGRRDRFVPARYAEAALSSHPSWRGRILPDVGHVPQMERPDRWLAEVADWFGAELR